MKQQTPKHSQPAAIVGISALYPGRAGKNGFWQDILGGEDRITEVPPSHWLIEDYYDADPEAPDKTYCKRGGFLSPTAFDPLEFGIPPATLPATDTAQLLALIVAKQVLEEAQRTRFNAIDKSRISVILGVGSTTELVGQLGSRLQRPVWIKALREAGLAEDETQAICDRIAANYVPWQESSFPGLLGNVVAGRIANRLDLGGTNYVTDAACASSFSALQGALNELTLGQSDLVITGGVDALNEILMYMCFSKTPAFSPTGDCRPFSDQADGVIIGEGLGMFALRRLADAERDGNTIYAVIQGIGSSSDGRSTSVYAPRPEGQALAIRRAYETAGYGPGTVELVEAHGTATEAGDAAEFEGLKSVFDLEADGRRQWCALGSVKSQIGHTKAAAGAAGMFKAVMALHHKVLPPTINVERPNPALHVAASPFFINTRPRPWIRNATHPRRAAVSAFGFGGSNFHVTVEEYTGPGARPDKIRTMPSELIVLSASTAEAIVTACDDFFATDEKLAALAADSQRRFDATAAHRLAVVATSLEDLKNKLEQAAVRGTHGETSPLPDPDIHYGTGAAFDGGIGFLFPGQGSQYVDMGADLAMAFDTARAVWDAAAGMDAFAKAPLHRTVFPPPAFTDSERMDQETAITAMAVAQPGIAAVCLSQLALLNAVGLRPNAVGGHSFGEVMALHAAGIFGRETTLAVALRRGELMTEAAAGTEGAMLAVGAARDVVAELLEAEHIAVVIANDNGPQQVVLSGATADIALAEARLGATGHTTSRLAVATAFHSPIVAGSDENFAVYLDSIKLGKATIPVYANATAKPYPKSQEAIRRQLTNQLAQPVRFREMIERMHADGIRLFIEVGPGAVLTGLVGQCLDGRPHTAVCLDRKGQDGILSLWRAFGRLSALGVALDFTPLWQELPPAIEQKRPTPAHAVYILGSNYGKPYPPPGGAADLPEPNPARQDTTAQPASQPVPPHPGASADSRLQAFKTFQQETAETHRHFQQAMAESHQAFLRMAEATLRDMTDGAPTAHSATERQPMPLPTWPMAPAPAELPVATTQAMPPPSNRLPSTQEGVAANPARSVKDTPFTEPMHDIQSVLLNVVAEKTGYPIEMLDLDMELEAGLGIDSIKQVEILSALQDRIPGLPEIKPARLAELKTLGKIVTFVAAGGAAVPTSSAADNRSAPGRPETEYRAPVERHAVDRHVLKTVDAPATGFAMPGLCSAQRIVVMPDDSKLSRALVAELHSRGLPAEACATVPANADAVISLHGLTNGTDRNASRTCHLSALGVARSIAHEFSKRGGVFVTVQDTGGDFGLRTDPGERAWLSGLPGLVKTAALEWPQARVKAIDLKRGRRAAGTLARTIAEELLAGGPELEVGLGLGGKRIIPCLAQTPSDDDAGLNLPLNLPDNGVVVVSGGGRGITAKAIEHLARGRRLRFALLGRTAMEHDPYPLATTETDLKRALLEAAKAESRTPSPTELSREADHILAIREIGATVGRLTAIGAEARYLSVDITNRQAVQDAIDSVRRDWGVISVLIHGAGVLADKHIADKTDEQFGRVFAAKVDGLRWLLDATRDDPLRTICVFSSVAARTGNIGQCDYAMANEVLNKVAQAEAQRRGSNCVVKSINWGPWDGGMVGDALKAHFKRLGIGLIPVEDGGAFLRRELSAVPGDGPVEVIVGNGIVAAAGQTQMEIVVDGETHSYLSDHAIKGKTVLPVVLVIEWFTRAAQAVMPDMKPLALRDLHVLQGVVLENFPGPERFHIQATPKADNGTASIDLTLMSEDGHTRYRATMEMGRTNSDSINAQLEPLNDGYSDWPWNSVEIYDGKLFHGPDFQVIRDLEGLSKEGGVGVFESTAAKDWPGGPWLTDPAALDGGLQLTALWSLNRSDRVFLPIRIGAFIPHGPLPAENLLRCEFRSRLIGTSRTENDLIFSTLDGRVVAELQGVEMYPIGSSDGAKTEAS